MICWFQDHKTPGSQPCRMNGPMSPVAMNVPARNHRLTISVEMAITMR